ncbi:MAG: hypothetical protein QM795_18175 [Pseudoxanthomonas sp.]
MGALVGAATTSSIATLLANPKPLRTGGKGLAGEYVALVALAAHKRDHVTIDVYADFTCPACQRLESEGLEKVRLRYGDRVAIRNHYIAGPATAPSAKILYDVAVAQGKGEPVAQALFNAKLKHGDDGANFPLVINIAERFGLSQPFRIALEDGSGRRKIASEWSALDGKVSFFPFIVIEDEIAVGGDQDNLMMVLRSVLAKEE